MKLNSLSLLALSASTATARFIEQHETSQIVINEAGIEPERFWVELEPGKVLHITEDEKWELRRVSAAAASIASLILTLHLSKARTSWT
jgi:hypothetical protein